MSRWWTGPIKGLLEKAGFSIRRQGAKLIVHSSALTPANVAAFASEHHLAWTLRRIGAASCYPDLVVDVGANRGQFGLAVRDAGYAGRLLSFEPQARIAAELADRVRGDASWQVRATALGDTDRSATLHHRAADDFASFAAPSVEGMHHFRDQMAEVGTEAVAVRRLDSLVAEEPWLADAKSIFLKVDTQGHDLEVLAGCGHLLRRVELLQLEAPIVPLYEGVEALPKLLEHVSALGFVMAGFFPIAIDRAHGAVLEADVRFIRRREGSA